MRKGSMDSRKKDYTSLQDKISKELTKDLEKSFFRKR